MANRFYIQMKQVGILVTISILAAILVSIFKYRDGEINYYNSDATWHTLYIIECYNETPIAEHLFLPIVTLGSSSDKYVPWGATIPDINGNYYYTSFSSAGYFLPWIFFKIFHLPVAEKSLYIFNTVLFAISAVLWTVFLYEIYAENRGRHFIAFAGTAIYIFSPELLHGMGVVYWHQSVMQVALLIQLLAYYQIKNRNSKIAVAVFYLFCVINPYIEWTGYVANGGYVLTELLSNRKIIKFGNRLKRAVLICCFTVVSFGIFVEHYLLRVDKDIFFITVKNRFLARSSDASISFSDVIGGYGKSFKYIWILVLIFIIWNIANDKKIEIKHCTELFIVSFMLCENLLMKQHAIAYPYDRMKCVFLLSLILCELIAQVLEHYESIKYAAVIILIMMLSICGWNYKTYVESESYIWETNYQADNKILAGYISNTYPNATYFFGSYIRGYMNLLFHRSIYEFTTLENAIKIADENGQAIVYINGGETPNLGVTGVFKIADAYYYNPTDDEIIQIWLENGEIISQKSKAEM